MPLLEEHQAAICRITSSTSAGQTRGTGFLVGDKRVLTAFHVVGDRPKKTLSTGPFRIEFGPRTATLKPFVTTSTVIADSNADDDWAVLEITENPPVATKPLRIQRVPRGYLIDWATWGFPDVDPDNGLGYSGTITISGAELQLYSKEAVEKQASQVRGLSGSPCVVDGAAVGVIVTASDPKGAGYTAGGALFAVPMEVVAAKSKSVKLPDVAPPFVPEVAGHLSNPESALVLSEVGRKLGLHTDAIAAARLPIEVATVILSAGLDATIDNVLVLAGTLDRRRALDILDCAGSLWIDGEAAAIIERAATTDDAHPLIGINVARPDTAIRYLHRAGYERARHPGWQKLGYALPPPKTEGQLRGLIDTAKEVLRRKFKCRDDQIIDELRKHPHDKRPIFLLIPPPVPAPRNVQRLKKAFRQVNFVLLLGTRPSDNVRGAFSTMTVIEPMLADGIETAVQDDYRRKSNEIISFYDEGDNAGATG